MYSRIIGMAALVALVLGGMPRLAPATLVQELSFEETVGRADYVVRGTVTAKDTGLLESPTYRIPVTRYTLTIGKTFMGADAPETLTLTNPGGVEVSPGRYMPMPEGFVDYPIGTEMVVLLAPTGKSTYAPVGLHQGTFRIEKDKDTGAETFVRLAASAKVVNQKGVYAEPLFGAREFTESEFVAALKAAGGKVGKSVREEKAAAGEPTDTAKDAAADAPSATDEVTE